MAGDGAFAAVGAAPGVRNPIAAAAALLAHGRRGLMPLGRIPPLFLAGEGAHRWAADHGLAAAADAGDSDYNVCAASRLRWQDHCRRLHGYCRAAGHGLEGPPAADLPGHRRGCAAGAGTREETGGGGGGGGGGGSGGGGDRDADRSDTSDSECDRDHDTVRLHARTHARTRARERTNERTSECALAPT
jgi:hypothetical protein